MDIGGVFFFGMIGAIVIVPQILRHQERQRLHETLRQAFERGQPVPPELIAALQWQGRRRRWSEYDMPPPEVVAGWTRPGATPASGYTAPIYAPPPPNAASPGFAAPGAEPAAGVPPGAPGAAPPVTPPVMGAPYFYSQTRRDLRRGLVWLAIGLGLIAAGGAFYAGLYDVGGAPETFSSFAALGAVPVFVGLTYLALWWAGKGKDGV